MQTRTVIESNYVPPMGSNKDAKIELTEFINGSGPKFGAHKWPALTVRASWPVGGESDRSKFVDELVSLFQRYGFSFEKVHNEE